MYTMEDKMEKKENILNINEEIFDNQEPIDHEELSHNLWKIFFGIIIYVVLTQTLSGLFSKFSRLDAGLAMIISTLIPLLFLKLCLPNITIAQIYKNEKKQLKLVDIPYFIGLMFLGTYLFTYISNLVTSSLDVDIENVMDVIKSLNSWPMFIYVVIIGPIVEETVYRGFLSQNLARYSKIAALVISTLIFAFMHINLEQAITVLGMAFILTYVGIFYSFKLSLILHIINNLQSMLMTNLIDAKGPESTEIIIYSLIVLIIIAYSIYRFVRQGRLEFSENMRQNSQEKAYTKEILGSIQMIALVLFFIVLMIVTVIGMSRLQQ